MAEWVSFFFFQLGSGRLAKRRSAVREIVFERKIESCPPNQSMLETQRSWINSKSDRTNHAMVR